jgi:hypothetical protein
MYQQICDMLIDASKHGVIVMHYKIVEICWIKKCTNVPFSVSRVYTVWNIIL